MAGKNPFGKYGKQITALTGGIASGKTAAAKEFRKLGAVIIDSDRIAREICRREKPVLKRIARRFGPGILDKHGSLDRSALGKIVFSDTKKRKALESIVHPLVIKEAAARIAGLKAGRMAILDAPLLFEAGLDRHVGRVIVVWTPKKLQMERLGKRDGLDRRETARRVAAQLPTGLKRRKADFVIDNSGRLADTGRQVKKIWEVLTKKDK